MYCLLQQMSIALGSSDYKIWLSRPSQNTPQVAALALGEFLLKQNKDKLFELVFQEAKREVK